MQRKYPLGRPSSGNDPRFTVGLMLDVGAVLERHGFPALTEGMDVVELQQALFSFIYKREDPEGIAAAAKRFGKWPDGTPFVQGESYIETVRKGSPMCTQAPEGPCMPRLSDGLCIWCEGECGGDTR